MTGSASGTPRFPRFVFLLQLMDMISLSLVLPVLPALVGELSGTGASVYFWYGVATLAFAVCFFFSAAVMGKLSDRFGRRPLMIASCAGLALGNFLCAMAPGLAMLMVGRALCGLSSANIPLAQAYVADRSSSSERGRALGLLGAMQGLGFIIGPMIGGHLGSGDLQIPFFVAALFPLAGGLAAVFLLRESLPRERRRWTGDGLHPLAALAQLRRLPGFGPLVPAVALVMLASNVVIISWVPYATVRFGWDTAQNGWGLFAFGLGAMLSQALFFPLAVKKFPVRLVCLAGLFSVAATYLALGLADRGWMVFVFLAANLAGYSVLVAFQTLASAVTGEQSQGATMGGLQALNNLALIVAPGFAAALLMAMAHFPASDWRTGLPLYFCAALVGGALVLAARRLASADPSEG